MKIKRKTIQVDFSIEDFSANIDLEKEDIVGVETGHSEHTDWITIWYVVR